MSKLIFCFSLLCFLIVKSCEKKTNQWEQLKDAAHTVGLCVYSLENVYCTEHQGAYSKREQSINLAEEDLYYFEMKEDWARTRIEGRAKFEKRPKEDYLILFDIRQGPFVFRDSSRVHSSSKLFVMINLKDKFTFTQSGKTDYHWVSNINNETGDNILENTLWREYMSGRQGRLSSNAPFLITNQKERSDLHDFIQAFFDYQRINN